MLNKTSVMRVLAAIIRDAGSAYSYYGFLPYLPSEFWSGIDVAPEADDTEERRDRQGRVPAGKRARVADSQGGASFEIGVASGI